MINQQLKQVLAVKDPFTDILGQETVKNDLKSALLVNRHVIIVGPPGIGKTTLAKNVAKLLLDLTVNDCSFHCDPKNPICPQCKLNKQKTKKVSGIERFIRLQGSPDLTVEDILGDIDPIKALKFGPLSLEAFTPGKIFKANNGILFFDELNRCPEKLQNALLQVLSEGKATIGSYDVDLPANFIFIATMNPEDSSTERLSDVLLDRFDVLYMNYPENFDIELRIVKEKGQKLDVQYPEDLLGATILFVRLLRESDKIEKKPSVRATIGLYERAQANAIVRGSNAVGMNDVKAALVSVLAHRIKLKPSVQYLKSPEDFIEEEFERFLSENRKSLEKLKGGSL
ncbi:ATP-binding protein [Candidatus Woesearchaeota archaeon]|nr:ATP-binding protein [Candidatus Woesearchaeota archaeon]